MSEKHPALVASESSAEFAMTKNREGWLGLFAEDAFLADPVGKSILDPEGQGHRGRTAIARFWDSVIANANLTLEASQRIVCDNTCVAVLKATNELAGGIKTTIDMVGLYEVRNDGKLTSLKVYWDFNQLTAQLQPQGFS